MSNHNLAQRQRLYKLLQVQNRELHKQLAGWTDDDYRYLLATCGATVRDGKPSATTMSISQMETALNALRVKGGKQDDTPHAAFSRDKRPRINKLMALWHALADAGVVQQRSLQAMMAWCENNVPGINKLVWADTMALNKAIEMLKGFAKSRGVKVY